MKGDRTLLALGILCLLGLGMLVSHLVPRPDHTAHLGFGECIWLTRRADLIVQLGLMFVGALGLRALLPSEEDADG